IDVVGGGLSTVVPTGGWAMNTTGKTMLSGAVLAGKGSVIPSRRLGSSKRGEARPVGGAGRSSGWMRRGRRPELEATSSRDVAHTTTNNNNDNNNDNRCCRRSCSTSILKTTAATTAAVGTALLSARNKQIIFPQKGVVPAGI
ncbi:unnamed protein product, partial [Ectocarpus fasciculatus]